MTFTVPSIVGLSSSVLPASVHAACTPAVSVASPSTRSVCALRSNATLVAVAASARAGAPPPGFTLAFVTTSRAVTEPFASMAVVALRAQGCREPRELVLELQRDVDRDRIVAADRADRAGRQIELAHRVAQLARILAPQHRAAAHPHALERETLDAHAARIDGADRRAVRRRCARRAGPASCRAASLSRARFSCRPSSSTVPISTCGTAAAGASRARRRARSSQRASPRRNRPRYRP